MELLGLRTLIYPSNDLQADKKWWSEVLGYEPYFDEPFYVGFNVNGYELGLDPNAKIEDGPRTYFGVNNVQGSVNHLVKLGCKVFEAPTETGGGIIVATVKRSNGQLLGLIYNPHFTAK